MEGLRGQDAADPKYWPGGIPEHIKCHHENIEWDNLAEEVKGWQLFLEENVIPQPEGPNSEDPDGLAQRRNLILQWISLSQDDRDAYHARAPLRKEDWWVPKGCYGPDILYSGSRDMPEEFCNIILPRVLSERQKGLWIKFLLMCYSLTVEQQMQVGNATLPFNEFYHGCGMMFGTGDEYDFNPEMTICYANPAGLPLTLETFCRWKYLENARLGRMSMTRTGTVIFNRTGWTQAFLDEQSLETGRLSLVEFDNNGAVEICRHAWPPTLGYYLCLLLTQGKGLFNVGNDVVDQPLDMGLPILDLLDQTRLDERMPGNERDDWKQEIDRIAPGYLKMEETSENNLVPDYDPSIFKYPDGKPVLRLW